MHEAESTLYYFRHSGGGVDGEASQESNWVPNTDVYIAGSELVIQVEIAGLVRKDLTLTVDGNRLMVSGHRQDTRRADNVTFLMMGINYGPFQSCFDLPPGFDLVKARASYDNGFLRIEVPPLHPTKKTIALRPPSAS